MISQGEGIPAISYDRRVDGQFGVNIGLLMTNMGRIGILPETSGATSIHFNPRSIRLGAALPNRWLDQLMFRAPYFRERVVLLQGFSLDQVNYKHKISILADAMRVPPAVRKSLASQDNISRNKVSKISDADCFGLILAHELCHVRDYQGKEKKFFVPKNEGTIRAYVADCVNKGKRNPWSGVVKLNN